MKLHPGRSIKTNLANVMKTQLKLAAMIDALNGKALDLLELRTRLEELLPEAERPEQPQVLHIKVPAAGYETTTGYEETGDDPKAPQATDAEQASGTPGAPLTEQDIREGVRVLQRNADAVETTAHLHGPEAPIVRRGKGGWPLGLSRAKTPCPHSPIPHRHRVADPNKPTELTCVGITYPEPLSQEAT